MKLNNIIFPMLAGSLLLVGCYDEKMDWHTPDGHNPVTTDDIPLQLQEQIDHYDYIKNYAAQYMPGTAIGVGLTADKYLDEDDPDYAALCDNNFQQFVTGNAMKMDAMVTSSGALNTTKLDAFLAKAPDDVEIFGHNFIWHTQQQQTYLLSLIAPKMIVETDGDIITMLQNGDFETGKLAPWDGWGGESTREVVAGEGVDGSYAAKLYNPAAGSEYSSQFVYNLSAPLENGKTYVLRFQIRAEQPGGSIQFAWQNLSYGNGEIYHMFDNIGTDWVTFEEEFTCTKDDAQQLCFNFGKVATTYYIDNIEFGTRKEEAEQQQANRATRATTITYELKTLEEKRTALLGAMESWIGGMLQHVSGDQRFVGWDVINEPITDDGYYRGIDGHFGGTVEDDNGNTVYDQEPTESTTDGLNLNWGSGHFYWGYYLGKDYAVKAFELARKYAPADMKLYVNDYNLETNPSKLAKLIEFVNYIDQN
ncbi:MAG TPA: endo-1,4-beta-xylanase, partial [Candidatus Prevotella stercoripullorum]|nr:endo-1,4-beta-xylanase [Candidatus Prevotella stercoripullorum]